MDVPTQVKWHMRGLLRNSGTEDDIRVALDLTAEAITVSGGALKGGIPSVQEVMGERLF